MNMDELLEKLKMLVIDQSVEMSQMVQHDGGSIPAWMNLLGRNLTGVGTC